MQQPRSRPPLRDTAAPSWRPRAALLVHTRSLCTRTHAGPPRARACAGRCTARAPDVQHDDFRGVHDDGGHVARVLQAQGVHTDERRVCKPMHAWLTEGKGRAQGMDECDGCMGTRGKGAARERHMRAQHSPQQSTCAYSTAHSRAHARTAQPTAEHMRVQRSPQQSTCAYSAAHNRAHARTAQPTAEHMRVQPAQPTAEHMCVQYSPQQSTCAYSTAHSRARIGRLALTWDVLNTGTLTAWRGRMGSSLGSLRMVCAACSPLVVQIPRQHRQPRICLFQMDHMFPQRTSAGCKFNSAPAGTKLVSASPAGSS